MRFAALVAVAVVPACNYAYAADMVEVVPSFAFGGIVVGETRTTTISVVNAGVEASGNLDLTTGDPRFAIASTTCGSVAPGASCAATVAFTPDALGAVATTLTIADDRGPSTTVDLTGMGIANALAFGGSVLDFYNVVLGSDLSEGMFVSNTSAIEIDALALTVTGDAELTLAPDGTCTATLAPDATCFTRVMFYPSTVGAKTAILRASALHGGSAQIPVTANAVAPQPFQLTPNSHDFGTVQVNQSATTTFQVTNPNPVSLLSHATISGSSSFTIPLGECSDINIVDPCILTVTFAPIAAGVQTAVLTVGGQTATLSGVGG